MFRYYFYLRLFVKFICRNVYLKKKQLIFSFSQKIEVVQSKCESKLPRVWYLTKYIYQTG